MIENNSIFYYTFSPNLRHTTSKVPFVEPEIIWLAIIPRILFIGILCLTYYQWDKKNFFLFAFVTYLIIWLGLRKLSYPKDVYKGINLIKEKKFDAAIPCIKRSIEFYSKHSWIDKHRILLMISSSKRPISETLICNLAYCLLQIGEIEAAKEQCEDALKRYPKSTIAKGHISAISALPPGLISECD